MKRFDIITILPEIVEPYIGASILGRAQKRRLVKFAVHDLRRWATDKHRTVDDKPYGGGPGMILKVEPIYRAVRALNAKRSTLNAPVSKRSILNARTRVILFSASGKQFTQRVAEQYAKKYDRIILICGRYEGVDARVAKYIADEEVSVGPYVLTGGELPALTVVDAVTRLVPGAIRPESLVEESFGFPKGRSPQATPQFGSPPAMLSHSFGRGRVGEYPQYTRPEAFHPNSKNKKRAWRVPKILLSGNHKKIVAWREAKLKRSYCALAH